MSWLQNSWMDNPTFLAEMAHFAWAYGILLTAALFAASRRQLLLLFVAFFAFALCKEYWYDLIYELPNDTVAGSTLDFVVYMVGAGLALGVIWIQRHCGRWPKKPPRNQTHGANKMPPEITRVVSPEAWDGKQFVPTPIAEVKRGMILRYADSPHLEYRALRDATVEDCVARVLVEPFAEREPQAPKDQ